ncbi:MAG TPA: hydantoinase/oxoprolinase family protein [Geminicoccaceae bacterium]|nr:hydantoinase/oxoprolinase family protein [Geminicoccus sp.]HMU48806.1 hydantoinase/oxoprolinase family protein [Geminicoccaceae bacterium]
MSLRLGIDTGGTFTDAALLDDAERVVATAKALTTRHDLSIGIAEAVGRVREAAPGPIGLVALSTTLATNAIVEGRGGRAALVLVGLDEATIDRGGLGRALGDAPVGFVAGGHAADGTESGPLDLAGAEALIARLAPEVEAFAVCGQFAVRNPAHELAVAAIARAVGRPATCSHELTARLDAPRRAVTTLLNARLIPEIAALLDAVEAMLAADGIDASLMVVTGDGSLVAADMARARPVETLLSGPAASIVGAAFLAGLDEALVADVGGTTTDIALLRRGRPRLSARGATVGGHATMVEAIEVHTAGLGGDSEVRQGPGGGLVLGPRRLMPLSLLADRRPDTLETLARQAAAAKPRPHDGRFVLRRRAPADPAALGRSARRLWDLLEDGPAPLAVILESHGLGRALARLGDAGIVLEAGFTPSDAAHVLGQQSGWSVAAARLGALICARQHHPSEPVDAAEMARRVLSAAGLRTGELLLRTALACDGEPAADILDGPARDILLQGLAGRPAEIASVRVALSCPVVAVGGPAPLFYPSAVAGLGTSLVLPPHHATCNAIGAVVGRIERTARTLVTALSDGGWRVHLPRGPRDLAELAAALELAEDAARRAAIAAAQDAGAPRAEVRCHRRERSFDDIAGERRVLEVEIVATATGRPPSMPG